MKGPKLFISHSHRDQDREWVERFSRSLAQKGLSAWSDLTEIHPGDDLEDAIETALRSSDAIVLVLDKDQAQSPWAMFELGAALGMGKRVIAVIPEDLDLERLPGPLRSRLSLVRSTPEETAQNLIERIAA